MTIHPGNEFRFAYASSLEQLRQHNIELTVGTDFEEFRELLAEARPGHAAGKLFAPGCEGKRRDQAFWIVGRDEDGSIMHTQAFLRFDLAELRLSDMLHQRFCQFIPANLDICEAQSSYRPGPSALRIRGVAVFHGEVWLGGDQGRYRGTGLSSMLGRHAFYSVTQAWDPDHLFGFMTNTVTQKGFAARLGYFRAEPGALRFALGNGGSPIELFMVTMSREDLNFALDLSTVECQALAA